MSDANGPTANPPLSSAGRVSPSAARRRLGVELRRLRERTGLRLSDVGQRLQRSQATVSRLENGTTPARVVDIEKLLEIYSEYATIDASTRESLLSLLSDSRRQEWFRPYRDVINSDMTAEHVGTYMEYESFAAGFVSFEPDLVPGLLQTPQYATAVVDAFFPERDQQERERLVQLRMLRKRYLDKAHPLEIDVVLGEIALRRRFGSAETMKGQLQALADEITDGRKTVRVRVVPAALAVPAAIGGPFVVMTFLDDRDQDVVYIEGRAGSTYLRDPADVASYQRQFDVLAGSALHDSQAVALIEGIIANEG